PEVWTTPERRALSQMARSFSEREIAPKLAEWEHVGEIPRDLHLNAAEVGLLRIGFPEEVGGSGGNAIDSALVTEAILAAGGSTGVCAALFTHGIALPHIAANGSDALIQRYVRPTLAGKMIGSLGVTEPGAGSDVANLRTRAVREGDTYVVNGAKTFIT
ncbi:acyl-CoA dehydrogenase family protein, partial [Mycobacteroides abscessus subsp. massiliense]